MSSGHKKRRVLRSNREIDRMRAAGLVVWQAHQAMYRLIAAGTTTAQLNAVVKQTFASYGAEPLFLGYGGPPPFPAETCISVNEELVHGIPGSRVLREGDIVSVDTGCRLRGWCGDAAYTHAVGKVSDEAQRLLDATLGALHLAIEMIPRCKLWSEVARAMEALVVKAGFHVVDSMVGHGIGQSLHEPPQVPNYFDRSSSKLEDFELRPGVVIAVEPMVNVGTPKLKEQKDRWTQSSADRSLAAHFEHTLAVTQDGVRVLTGPPSDEELSAMPEWLSDRTKWVVW